MTKDNNPSMNVSLSSQDDDDDDEEEETTVNVTCCVPPSSTDNKYNNKNISLTVQQQQQQQSQQQQQQQEGIHDSSSSSLLWCIQEPMEYDILFGRGKQIASHKGNQLFRHIIQTRRKEYQTTNKRQDKSRITEDIVQTLLCTGTTRFLRQDTVTHLYYQVDMESVREKVSHALRNRPLNRSIPTSTTSTRTTTTTRRTTRTTKEVRGQPLSQPQKRKRRIRKEWSKEQETYIQRLIQEQQMILQTFIGQPP